MSASPTLIDCHRRSAQADLLAMRQLFGEFVPIDWRSPLQPVVHRHAGKLAREMMLDYPPNDLRNPKGIQFIIASEDGRPIGAMQVAFVEWSNAPPSCLWCWVRVNRAERGQGWVEKIWRFLRPLFPGIEPDPPFSYPVARFFVERDDV